MANVIQKNHHRNSLNKQLARLTDFKQWSKVLDLLIKDRIEPDGWLDSHHMQKLLFVAIQNNDVISFQCLSISMDLHQGQIMANPFMKSEKTHTLMGWCVHFGAYRICGHLISIGWDFLLDNPDHHALGQLLVNSRSLLAPQLQMNAVPILMGFLTKIKNSRRGILEEYRWTYAAFKQLLLHLKKSANVQQTTTDKTILELYLASSELIDACLDVFNGRIEGFISDNKGCLRTIVKKLEPMFYLKSIFDYFYQVMMRQLNRRTFSETMNAMWHEATAVLKNKFGDQKYIDAIHNFCVMLKRYVPNLIGLAMDDAMLLLKMPYIKRLIREQLLPYLSRIWPQVQLVDIEEPTIVQLKLFKQQILLLEDVCYSNENKFSAYHTLLENISKSFRDYGQFLQTNVELRNHSNQTRPMAPATSKDSRRRLLSACYHQISSATKTLRKIRKQLKRVYRAEHQSSHGSQDVVSDMKRLDNYCDELELKCTLNPLENEGYLKECRERQADDALERETYKFLAKIMNIVERSIFGQISKRIAQDTRPGMMPASYLEGRFNPTSCNGDKKRARKQNKRGHKKKPKKKPNQYRRR